MQVIFQFLIFQQQLVPENLKLLQLLLRLPLEGKEELLLTFQRMTLKRPLSVFR